jgi:hypothetical protein
MEPEMMRDDFKVDKNNLDEEWERQPTSGFDYGTQLANARHDRDHAKRLMDLALADAMDFVLQNYEDYGLNKQQANSSTFVRNAAVKSDDYQKAYKEYIDKEHDVNILQGASYAMLDRKESLRNLTRLFLADYYSTDTTIPEDRRDALREKELQHRHKQVLEENPRLKKIQNGRES